MSIASALGLATDRKVRYAVVALGDIAQEAMLPGVKHTGNSVVTALVTGDPSKARGVGAQYGVDDVYGYEQFDAMLRSGTVDALYLATPNWRHAEFAVPALDAGIHVLVEKPLEASLEAARAILDAQKRSRAKLMTAYRLHFEPATLATLDVIRSGDLGDVLYFTSTFIQPMDRANHRAQSGVKAGPIFDMGPYPVNAARLAFEAEPEEVVSAVGVRHPDAGFGDGFDDTVMVVLRFPGNRFAQILISYHGNAVEEYTVAGTRGSVAMNPGYTYGKPLEQVVTLGEKKTHHSFRNTDQFGGEMRYFSDCILHDRAPEPDAEEGYADVRVLDGISRAIASGGPVRLEPFTRTRRIDTAAQKQMLFATRSPELVNTASPMADKEKMPKN